jgi:enoyl-CoA hydratase
MDLTTIQFERANGVATITLDRPAQGNAINAELVADLKTVCEYIEDEVDEKVVVIRGAGGQFCAGIDLTDFPVDEKPNVYGFGKWESACRTIERLPKVTVAAVDGECAGGGFQLALTCDVRVATERAVFHLHEVRDGFLPGMGTFRLSKFIGLGRARRLALTGRRLRAEEAQRIGLVDHLCPDSGLDIAVADAIEEFGEINPVAIELCRRLFDESFEMPYEEFIGSFLAAQHRAVQTEPFLRRVRKAHGVD